MNKSIKSKLCIALAAMSTISLIGCNTETAESNFDNPLPWHDDVTVAPQGSFEALGYDVAIYDTTESVDEAKRKQIASGALSYVLEERMRDTTSYVTVTMTMVVTYFEDAPAPDAGLTDTVTSTVEFASNSLAARSMTKTVELADRDGKENLSYKVTADYFDTHVATYTATAKENSTEQKLSLPADICRDNEMMIYCARAQSIAKESSTNFKMVNVFDSFNLGKLTEYRMAVTGGDTHSLDIGDWVKDFGIEAVTDEATGELSYPVSCTYTSILINDEKHGPPYVVLYSEKPFANNGRSHSKIPVRIEYSQYNGSSPYRHTEYTLKSCAFEQ